MPTLLANANNPVHIEAGELGTVQKITFSGTSTASTPISADVSVVRIIARSGCHVVWGATPTATVNDTFIAPNREEWLKVPEDNNRSLAVIEAAPSSAEPNELYITELV